MFVRQHNKPFYVFPGGKQDDGETIEQALEREIREELSTEITNAQELGVVTGQTPDGRDLEMHLFTADLLNEPKASGEIVDILWLDRESILKDKSLTTPITIDHVVPFLDKKGMWWSSETSLSNASPECYTASMEKQKHYVCLGGCKGVSEWPGVCQAPDCANHQHELVECDCTDGQHHNFDPAAFSKAE